MKRTVILLLVIVFMLGATGCNSYPSDTQPQALEALQSGERIPFAVEMLRDLDWSSSFKKNTIHLNVATKGFDGVDYFDCAIRVCYRATVIFENMTEELVEREYNIYLPFSGEEEYEFVVEFTEVTGTDWLGQDKYGKKPIHAIHDEAFEFEVISGEIIKK